MNDTPVQLGAAVLLKQEKGWTYGLLTNHVWSFAGTDSRQDVRSTFLQPFLSYTTKTYTTFGVNTESTYDWENSQWTVPINAQASQLLKLGSQPVQLTIGVRYYAEKPQGGPDWGPAVRGDVSVSDSKALRFCSMRDDDQNSGGSLPLPEGAGI